MLVSVFKGMLALCYLRLAFFDCVDSLSLAEAYGAVQILFWSYMGWPKDRFFRALLSVLRFRTAF